MSSYLTRSIKDSGLRDVLLKIGRTCPSFSLLNTVSSQANFGEWISPCSPETANELDNCFCETKSTRQITLLDWPRDKALLTKCSRKCTITKEELQAELEDEKDKSTRAITVRVLNLEWFYRDKKNFSAFTTLFDGLPNQVYSSEFLTCLLDQFWEKEKDKILKRRFVPYLLFLIFSTTFMYAALREKD